MYIYSLNLAVSFVHLCQHWWVYFLLALHYSMLFCFDSKVSANYISDMYIRIEKLAILLIPGKLSLNLLLRRFLFLQIYIMGNLDDKIFLVFQDPI